MARKYQSTVLSTEFVRAEVISSESNFTRYGKFKDVAYASLSCGHKALLSSIKIKTDGFCFCFDCKWENEQ
jgi:hypothetical protein